MLKIGITGGIGSGKSTVCHLFKCLGIPVFNADDAGRRLLSGDIEVIEQVKNIFGEQVLVDGKPDREKLAKLVFTNAEKLTKLNAIIHPAVRKDFDRWVTEQVAPYVLDESAILFETSIYKQLDYTILVIAPEELRIKRVLQRDNTNEAAVKNRMKNQWSDDEKKQLADFIITNDDINPVLPQVKSIHDAIISKLA